MAEAWEKRDDESAKAYAAFKAFRGLGIDRSIRDAYRLGAGRSNARQASGRWSIWAKTFDWDERAAAYDRHIDAVERKAQEEAVAEERKRWVVRQSDSREKGWTLGTGVLTKAEQMLRFPVIETVQDEIVEKDKDGRAVTVKRTIVKPTRWSFADAAKMAQTGIELMRMACGLSTGHVSCDVLNLDETATAPEMSHAEIQDRLVELVELARSRRAAAILEAERAEGVLGSAPEGFETVETPPGSSEPGLL